MDLSGLGCEQVTDCCEHDDKLSGSIEGEGFLD